MNTTVITELGALRGFQEFQSTTDPSAALAQAYTFKLTLNGTVFNSGNDISVTLTALESLSSIATKIQTAINAITASSVAVSVNTTTLKIRVSSNNATQLTSSVSILAPGAGSSLITLLGGIGTIVTMPQIIEGSLVNETKTLPIVVVSSGQHTYQIASVNLLANIKRTPFSIFVYASSLDYAELLAGEVRRIVDAKSMAGGWWHCENIFYEKGNTLNSVAKLIAEQHLFITTPAWS